MANSVNFHAGRTVYFMLAIRFVVFSIHAFPHRRRHDVCSSATHNVRHTLCVHALKQDTQPICVQTNFPHNLMLLRHFRRARAAMTTAVNLCLIFLIRLLCMCSVVGWWGNLLNGRYVTASHKCVGFSRNHLGVWWCYEVKVVRHADAATWQRDCAMLDGQ